MPRQFVTIVDRDRNAVATGDVELRGDRYCGTVDAGPMPGPIREMFEGYEEIVNDQMFGLLDGIEDQIGQLRLAAVFGDGREVDVEDLQIFPGGGSLSFRVSVPLETGVGPVGHGEGMVG